ncbi:MAG TPA: SAM-dependent methyltransferase [Roseomonas sp.]|jgi:trans-aconitate methyltransferase
MSLGPSYFDALYSCERDPWGFESSAYERAKYTATLAALPRRRYRQALEIGCSIGVLTAQLAGRCDALVAVDGAEAALAEARRRCATLPQVRIESAWVPGRWPQAAGGFDLILLSEVLYYLDLTDIARLVERIRLTARPGADIVAVHWTGATDYPLTADAALQGLSAALGTGADLLLHRRHPRYRIDVLRLATPASQ